MWHLAELGGDCSGELNGLLNKSRRGKRFPLGFQIVRIRYQSVSICTDGIKESFSGGLQRPSLEERASRVLGTGSAVPTNRVAEGGLSDDPQLRSSFTTKEGAVPGVACHPLCGHAAQPSPGQVLVGEVLEKTRG